MKHHLTPDANLGLQNSPVWDKDQGTAKPTDDHDRRFMAKATGRPHDAPPLALERVSLWPKIRAGVSSDDPTKLDPLAFDPEVTSVGVAPGLRAAVPAIVYVGVITLHGLGFVIL